MEKGGKDREITVRHDLALWLNQYIAGAGIAGESKAPLFRAAAGKRKLPTEFFLPPTLHASDDEAAAGRCRVAGFVLAAQLRVTVVTDLLNQNVPLEDAQYVAGPSSPTTTRVYDRGRRKVTRNIVERISI